MAKHFSKTPQERRIRWKFLRARNQARFWRQPWTITWDEWYQLFLAHPEHGGREEHSINLGRINRDPQIGWRIDNVEFKQRRQTHRGRSHKRLPDGTPIVRSNTRGTKDTPRWKSRSKK